MEKCWSMKDYATMKPLSLRSAQRYCCYVQIVSLHVFGSENGDDRRMMARRMMAVTSAPARVYNRTKQQKPQTMKSIQNAIFSRSRLARAESSYVIVLALLLLSLPIALRAQTLRNEWSFNEGGGSTAVDSISSSNITLVGGASLGRS